jgi:Skp family chaperone for outer membrane proteins
MQMFAELADVRAGIEAELAALNSELAAAQAELHAARAELENLKVLRAADEAAKLELARRRTSTEAAAAQRDADTPLQ